MALINYLTQVQFGYDALGQLAAECQRIGITRPFIVTDTGCVPQVSSTRCWGS